MSENGDGGQRNSGPAAIAVSQTELDASAMWLYAAGVGVSATPCTFVLSRASADGTTRCRAKVSSARELRTPRITLLALRAAAGTDKAHDTTQAQALGGQMNATVTMVGEPPEEMGDQVALPGHQVETTRDGIAMGHVWVEAWDEASVELRALSPVPVTVSSLYLHARMLAVHPTSAITH